MESDGFSRKEGGYGSGTHFFESLLLIRCIAYTSSRVCLLFLFCM